MPQDNLAGRFTLPAGLLGRFGVIKLWPDIQVAEDEVIARLVNTAEVLGLECVVLDHMGRPLEGGGEPLTDRDLDFAIHLHFSTPKSYDIFSFVTIWNPPRFLHDFGYRASAENLLSHDDYLTCRSPGADLHLRRLIKGDASHLPPQFELFHSLAKPVLPPTLGEFKVFYLGINWERLGRGPSRHQDVLTLLDGHGCLRIFGPEELRGVRVWEGFEGYQRSLPFDGVSVIEEIHKAGICLALSSEAHKDVVMMSNRLFEGLAAGALIICDENAWAKTYFGDTLLYIDTRDGADAVAQRVLDHVAWARANPEAALTLAARAQDIFRQRFTMDASLAQLYQGLTARKAQLAALTAADVAKSKIQITFMAPDIGAPSYHHQLAAARAHAAQGFDAVLLVDQHDLAAAQSTLPAAPEDGFPPHPITLEGADYFQRDSEGTAVRRNRIGGILKKRFEAASPDSLLAFVAPNETVYGNHFAMLAGVLAQEAGADYAWSRAILRNIDGLDEPHFSVEPELDLLSRDPSHPIGLGRFLFRADRFSEVLDLMLESLDTKSTAALAFFAKGRENQRASLIIDIRAKGHLGIAGPEGTERDIGPELWHDMAALRDLYPARFDAMTLQKQVEDQIHRTNQALEKSEERLRYETNVLRYHEVYVIRNDVAAARDDVTTVRNDVTAIRNDATVTREDITAARHDAEGLRRNVDDTQGKLVDLRTLVEGLQNRQVMPETLFLDRLSRANRRGIILQLLRALPVPEGVWHPLRKLARIGRKAYRRIAGRG